MEKVFLSNILCANISMYYAFHCILLNLKSVMFLCYKTSLKFVILWILHYNRKFVEKTKKCTNTTSHSYQIRSNLIQVIKQKTCWKRSIKHNIFLTVLCPIIAFAAIKIGNVFCNSLSTSNYMGMKSNILCQSVH